MIRETVTTRFCCQRSAGGPAKTFGPVGPSLILEHETLVELIGFEPTTYGLQSRRSPD